MKYCFFSLIIVFLFYLYLCEETKNQTEDDILIKKAEIEEKFGKTQSSIEDSPEETQKRIEENERKLKEQIGKLLKEFGLENAKTIKKEQFKNIFVKMIEEALKENEENKNGNEKNIADYSSLMKGFIDLIFDNLISKDIEEIEIDKIMDFFEPQNILNALKSLLKSLNLDNLIDLFSAPLLEAFGVKNNATNTTNTNNTNIKEEKNADL